MDLGKITARVRPRNPNEAADLGVVMARQWFWPLLILWLLPSFPLMLVLFILFYDQPWWAALILWWLKPLWETLQLQFVAEALFNPQMRWRSVMRQARQHVLRHFLAKLLIQRWSLSRSFNMPVGELERLDGSARSRRLSVLHRDASSSSVWLTLLGNTIEGLLVLALFSTVWMLVPMKMEVDFTISDFLDSPLLFPALTWSAYIAMALVSPFYVCCGFMLYINRRTWLEAWDIELTFRQLASKPMQAASKHIAMLMLVALPLLTLAPTTEIRADTTLTPSESQQQIIEILESDDFNEMKEKTGLRWKDEDRRNELQEDENKNWLQRQLEKLGDWMRESTFIATVLDWLGTLPNLLEALLWGTVIALMAYLIFRFRHVIAPGLLGETSLSKKPKPTHLFGLELNKQSLPDDVLSQARQLWQQQRQRDALSLLYRAALSQLVHQDHVPLEDCHTESECVALCRRSVEKARTDYFRQLTSHWINLAYAHRLPDDASFEQLCDHWQGFAASGMNQ